MKTCPTSFQRPAYISLCAHAQRPLTGPAHLCNACRYTGPLGGATTSPLPDAAPR